MSASETEKHFKIRGQGTGEERQGLVDALRQAVPPTWVAIDEAQNILPAERRTSATDVIIKDKDGKEIYSQKDFQKLALSSRIRNHEFMTRFTFQLTGLPAGDYTLETTLRDAVSSKSGTFSLTFVIK